MTENRQTFFGNARERKPVNENETNGSQAVVELYRAPINLHPASDVDNFAHLHVKAMHT